jgi:acyl-coenzyme A synthetase/AMP-(fatty) acid ligase
MLPSIREMIGADLKRELMRRRITAMLAPAAALNHIVRFDRDSFNGLRLLCSGGDVLLPATCRALRAGGFTGELLNLYGPTETTVACTGHLVEDVDAESIPIGTGLEGVDIHVLDADMRPVPDGEIGELYVGGAGVGRGYIGRPDLTDERFLRWPSGSDDRVYRTGDLVGRTPDGVLDYRGRADNQVKISGVRVEPAEVERALCRHGVAEAAVTAAGPPEERRLVAFLVLDRPLVLRELRAALAEDLPAQLVPHDLVVVEAITTDHHGKRDWKQLTAIHRDRERSRADHVPPRDDTEWFLTCLWEDLLAVEHVGATDDFFELGGHSLLAVRARSAIRTQLGVALAPESIFEHSVLEELSAAINSARGAR